MNKKGFSLIEVLVVTVIGLFIMEAAYLLYSGSMKLFKDVKTKSDNLETKMPSIELIGRYFERWGVNVYSTGASTVNCTNYPPSDQMCITLTDATPCDEVTYWGNTYAIGFVKGPNASDTSKMDVVSCRLNSSDSLAYYIWRGGILQTVSGTTPSPVTLTGLTLIASTTSGNNLDCSTATSPNAKVNKNIITGDLQPGDVIQRAPYKIRFYCGSNSSDSNNQWLYVEQTDTLTNIPSPSEPIAPVDSFQVELLPSSSVTSGTCIECMAVKVAVSFRSQSKTYSRETKNLTVERIFGR
jgi:prepilin-type N-terminal cleavage/methylation domain-containing protein